MVISSDQCRSVEKDLRNSLNVVCTSVMRAEGFYKVPFVALHKNEAESSN